MLPNEPKTTNIYSPKVTCGYNSAFRSPVIDNQHLSTKSTNEVKIIKSAERIKKNIGTPPKYRKHVKQMEKHQAEETA
jgi:hypothetical protein